MTVFSANVRSRVDGSSFRQILTGLKPVLNWANVCFLIELLVRRTWFGQFHELYFVLNRLVMRCKLRPELAADAQQTA